MAKRPAIKLPTKPAVTREPLITQESNNAKPPKNYVRASLYLPRPVHEELRKLAFEHRRSQHELLLEALDVVLERYSGKSRRDLLAEAG